jgi:hypothetical protein
MICNLVSHNTLSKTVEGLQKSNRSNGNRIQSFSHPAFLRAAGFESPSGPRCAKNFVSAHCCCGFGENMISITLARARENLKHAGVSHTTAALLVGLRPSTLTAAFREAVRLDPRVEANLLTISARCVELRETFKPFGLPEDSTNLQSLVDGLMNGRISLEKIRESVRDFLGQ